MQIETHFAPDDADSEAVLTAVDGGGQNPNM
jgi:hypothetical protein